jgi:4-amino-4-deoxy-L-arabinose transferase-like glycosyltransferase
MAFLGHVFEPQPAGPASGDLTGDRRAFGARRLAHAIAAVRRAPELGGLIGLAALLNLWALGRNGWANTYYSAAVRSMAASWHNFLYASLDPSGVMTVDKPPLSLWIQALSVRVFGYHPLAILVPQALMGVASVVLVYDLVRRRFGRLGGLVAGLALATTPIAVAMSRDNNPDALLTLCCVAAVWFAVRAFEDGRTRWLVFSGIAVGLGFEAKMGVALAVVPAIALAWLWIAPRGRVAAIRQLLAGGGAMLAVGGAWPLLVSLTPSADRPWISGTSDNSIFSLIFGYNGFGRVSGQSGGPAGVGPVGVFGQGTGPFRLVNAALGGQDGWLLGFAVVGAVVVLIASRARRQDPRTAWIAVVGGAFLVIAALFSFAQGIFHPYYVVLLAPFTAALVGAGAASVATDGMRSAIVGTAALAAGTICEFVVLHDYNGQLGWLRIVLPIVCGGAAVSLFALSSARAHAWAIALGTAALLIAPTVWAFDTLGYATQSTFPAGGPASANLAVGGGFFAGGGAHRGAFAGRVRGFSGPAGGAGPALFGGAAPGATGPGGGPPSVGGRGGFFGGGLFGGGGGLFADGGSLSTFEAYAKSHGGGTIAVSSQSDAASAIIASDARVAGIGGFSGQESDPSISWLADEVAAGKIRWVYGGGVGSFRVTLPSGAALGLRRTAAVRSFGLGGRPGATAALNAAARVCTPVAAVSSLYDCAGKASALRALS